MVLTLALTLSSCARLPIVADDLVKSIEANSRVEIVMQVERPNPTDEWMYTYLLLEVSGEDPQGTIATSLAQSGWKVKQSADSKILLVATRLPEADLFVMSYLDFMPVRPSAEPDSTFVNFPRRSDRTYFVVTMKPL
jgi:hypothetical protein